MGQISSELNASLNVKYMATMMVEQISGLPAPKNDGYIWTKPEIIDVKGDNDICILFIDDAHLCSKTIQSYLFQLLTYKSIHNHKLPENVAIVLAGNRSIDRSGAQPIMAPIVNRMYFIEVTADAKDWIENFAIPMNLRSDIVSFIDFYPELLQSEPLENEPWASPRSWTFLNDSLNQIEESNEPITNQNLLIIATGHIGSTYATKFCEYKIIFSKWKPEIYFNNTKLPNINNLNSIECYTLMSSVIAEFIKQSRLCNFKLNKNYETVLSQLFNSLVEQCKEIIPLGLKTIATSDKKNIIIFQSLIKNNKYLLEATKSILGIT